MTAAATPPISPLGEAAIRLAAHGWAVFPCTGKRPLTRHGCKDGTTDPGRIREFWTRHPAANIGLATGAVSGVFGLDIDVKPGGEATLAKLEAEHGALPPTRTVRTGSGGHHLYFKYPGGRVPNSAGQLGPGLDVRGDGGYLVAPPSVHPDGGAYVWEDEREPVEAPAWLLARVVEGERSPATADPASPAPAAAAAAAAPAAKERTDFGPAGGTRYGLSALDQEAGAVATTPEGQRNQELNRAAFRIGRLVAGGELDRMFAARRLVEAGIAAGLSKDEAMRTTKSGLVHGLRRPRSAPPRKRADKKKAKEQKPLAPRPVENTDLGNARRLAGRFGEKLRHCAALGWYVWDGQRWARDETGAAMRLAKQTAEMIWDEVKSAPADEQETLARFALASQSAARLDAMLRLAATEETIAVTADTFDRDPWVLNVLNGTIDLRTGELLPHDPARHLTKIAPVRYEQDAACPRFLRFLADVFRGNAELIRFVQKALGYALTGDVSFQVVFFCHGDGSNGKSTLLSVVMHVMGDYAAPAAPDILLSRHGERHPTEIADLFGRRLVTCVEVGKGRSFNEALLKWLTGGDRLKARHMRRDFFEFPPTHKIFVCANNKPRVRETDHAFWRRMRLVPFDVKFVDRPPGATGEPGPGEKDEFLVGKLQAEAPGILRWMVEGCLALQREGLSPPREVEAATEAYRRGEDVLGLFLDECCVLAPGARVRKAELYEAYVAWAKQAGEHAVSMREFRKSLLERGAQDTRMHGGAKAWKGIGLAADGGPGDRVTDQDRVCPMTDDSPTRVGVNRQSRSWSVTGSPEASGGAETSLREGQGPRRPGARDGDCGDRAAAAGGAARPPSPWPARAAPPAAAPLPATPPLLPPDLDGLDLTQFEDDDAVPALAGDDLMEGL